MEEDVTLFVNGREHRVRVEPGTPLLYVLRNDLGLPGAKFGCGLEQCGACKVLVDGEALPSCREPVASFRGRRITTIEGLGTPERLHPVQQAFVDEEAAQCGFCIPGMVVGAAALLEQNPDPSDAEIREALAKHLCRCGTYTRVLKAVRRAAQASRR
jgi:nicotinate dehydrogenase subunit A